MASEAPASEAAAATGTPLYLVDGNTGNALGEKLPAGTLNGVKGTIPGAENTQDFKDALLEVDPERHQKPGDGVQIGVLRPAGQDLVTDDQDGGGGGGFGHGGTLDPRRRPVIVSP